MPLTLEQFNEKLAAIDALIVDLKDSFLADGKAKEIVDAQTELKTLLAERADASGQGGGGNDGKGKKKPSTRTSTSIKCKHIRPAGKS